MIHCLIINHVYSFTLLAKVPHGSPLLNLPLEISFKIAEQVSIHNGRPQARLSRHIFELRLVCNALDTISTKVIVHLVQHQKKFKHYKEIEYDLSRRSLDIITRVANNDDLCTLIHQVTYLRSPFDLEHFSPTDTFYWGTDDHTIKRFYRDYRTRYEEQRELLSSGADLQELELALRKLPSMTHLAIINKKEGVNGIRETDRRLGECEDTEYREKHWVGFYRLIRAIVQAQKQVTVCLFSHVDPYMFSGVPLNDIKASALLQDVTTIEITVEDESCLSENSYLATMDGDEVELDSVLSRNGCGNWQKILSRARNLRSLKVELLWSPIRSRDDRGRSWLSSLLEYQQWATLEEVEMSHFHFRLANLNDFFKKHQQSLRRVKWVAMSIVDSEDTDIGRLWQGLARQIQLVFESGFRTKYNSGDCVIQLAF